jgi:hypothetical protein
MECKDVEAVLEQEGLSPLPLEAREHLSDCQGCRQLLTDFSAIAVAAKRIPAEENPPERIWISLRAQLEAEGIIRQPQVAIEPVAAPWWQLFAQLLRPRVLAMVGAGVLAVAGGLYYANRPPTVGPNAATSGKPLATQPASPAKNEALAAVKPAAPTLSAENVVKKQPARTVTADQSKPGQVRESTTVLRPSPTELASFGESAATLSQTERAVPSRELADNAAVDAALRENLRILNGFIAECEARLKENPRDQLTQEYLNMALQQKAELLNAMMDSGRSEH